jgi:AcrR family transcriptional regulator
MVKSAEATDWREARRRAARDSIVEAAWALVGEAGLAGLSLRDLARRAGITTPTVYAYFDSKNAIYDAMFGQAATQFAREMAEPYGSDDPRQLLVARVRRFFEFCTSDPARYQLLFQRTLPGFEPSPESYAPAVQALALARESLAANGVVEEHHLDMWTALVTGLVDQQMSNDPGGERWARLIDESISMFLAHCAATRSTRSARPGQSHPSRRRGARA